MNFSLRVKSRCRLNFVNIQLLYQNFTFVQGLFGNLCARYIMRTISIIHCLLHILIFYIITVRFLLWCILFDAFDNNTTDWYSFTWGVTSTRFNFISNVQIEIQVGYSTAASCTQVLVEYRCPLVE